MPIFNVDFQRWFSIIANNRYKERIIKMSTKPENLQNLAGRNTKRQSPLRIDMTGKRIGMLTVKEFVGRSKANLAVWECLCDCGRLVRVTGTSLRSGEKYSCGCAKKPSGFFRQNYGVGFLVKEMVNGLDKNLFSPPREVLLAVKDGEPPEE
jgi:hypothetical protein